MRKQTANKKYKWLQVSVLVVGLMLTAAVAFGGVSALADGCSSTTVNGYNGNQNPCIGAVPQNANTVSGSSNGNDLIGNYVNPLINFLAGAVGLVVTISLVAAGIQYASSADDPSKVAAAKKRIVNTLIALLSFLFLYAFLQWLVPGGFLNG